MRLKDWILGPREDRESFTSQAIAASVRTAELGTAGSGAAIFEACAGLCESRAFAGGTSGELSSDVLARIGRELVTFGQSLWVVQGKTILSPVSSVDIEGGFDPASWVYRCSTAWPNEV